MGISTTNDFANWNGIPARVQVIERENGKQIYKLLCHQNVGIVCKLFVIRQIGIDEYLNSIQMSNQFMNVWIMFSATYYLC